MLTCFDPLSSPWIVLDARRRQERFSDHHQLQKISWARARSTRFDLGIKRFDQRRRKTMMMMGYFRAPRRLQGRRKPAEGELRAALLVGEEEAVPKGYFAVYVGAEARRFVVPTSYLCQPAFRELMERAAEEFGFAQAAGLRLPCREEDFVATVAALHAAAARRRRTNRRIKAVPL